MPVEQAVNPKFIAHTVIKVVANSILELQLLLDYVVTTELNFKLFDNRLIHFWEKKSKIADTTLLVVNIFWLLSLSMAVN